MYDEIFNELEKLFKDDPTVEVRRENNTISFSQTFTDNIHLKENIPETEKSRFTHIVMISNNSYKTIDVIESKEASSAGFKVQYKKGHFVQTGFILAPGIDNTTGKAGLVLQKWSTGNIKKPVKARLKELGIRKVGLFG